MTYSIGSKGFTLIEIVVSAAVLAILATIGIIQVRSLSTTQTLENGSDDVRSFISLTRSYAQTGHVCCSDVLPNGYGDIVTIDGTPDASISMYADLDNSTKYSSGDEILNTIVLPTDVNFTQCADDTTTMTTGTCDLFFSGTQRDANYFNGVAIDGSYVLTLEHPKAGTDQVTVYSFGVIE